MEGHEPEVLEPVADPGAGPRPDRGLALTVVLAAAAIALAALPALDRTDGRRGDRLEASAAASSATGPEPGGSPEAGSGSGGETGAAAPPVSPTIVLPNGVVIPYSAYVPPFVAQGGSDGAPLVLSGTTTPPGRADPRGPTSSTAAPPTSGRGSSTTRPSTTTTRATATTGPSTTTTRATTTTRPTPTTRVTLPQTPGRRCASYVPRGYFDEAHAQFIFDGQSMSTVPTPGTSWPVKLMQTRFRARAQAAKLVSIRGSTYARRESDAATRVDAYIAHPTAPDVTTSVLFDDGGQSDLQPGMTAEDAFRNAAAYHQNRRRAGYSLIVGATITPGGVYSPEQDLQRRRYNDALRWSCWDAGIDVLVDLAAVPELSDHHDATYFQPEHGYEVHYTDAGSTVVAREMAKAFP